MAHSGGGVEATFGQCPKERLFFLMASLSLSLLIQFTLFQQALAAIVCRLSLELATRRKPTGFTSSGNTMVSVLYMYETS